MGPVPLEVKPNMPLYETLEKMRKEGVKLIPVVSQADGKRPVGTISPKVARRAIMLELHRRHAGEGEPVPA